MATLTDPIPSYVDMCRVWSKAERAEFDALMAELAQGRVFFPTPKQLEVVESEADIVGYGGAAGGGKLLKLTQRVQTLNGLKTMGELEVGDVLFDKDGAQCRVTALSTIDPRPELIRFTFDDGTIIDSCVDHQWLTYNVKELAQLTRKDEDWRARRRAARPSRATGKRSAVFTAAISARNSRLATSTPQPEGSVRTTQEIVDTLFAPDGRRNHAIPLTESLQAEDVELPIPPYTLGAWLGDGTNTSGGFTGVDPEIWQRIEQDGFKVSQHVRPESHHIIGLKPLLRAENLLSNKHIPRIYFKASPAQRLELLKGLMDTDGTVAKHSGAAEFCNTREALIDDTLELICSLGWKARKREGRALLHGKDCGAKWTLKFNASVYVFNLERKRGTQKLATRRTTRFRYIVAAENIASEPGRCIMVDSPSNTYLIGRECVVTHNSYLACGLAATEHQRSHIIRPQKNQTKKFVQELTKMFGTRDGYSSQTSSWQLPTRDDVERYVQFFGLDAPGDEEKQQGDDADLKFYDESTQMREEDVRYTLTWNRTDDPKQRVRAVFAFNPPTTAEGRWVIRFFAPWLDEKHPNPAKEGELRWFTTVGDDKDFEVAGPQPFVLKRMADGTLRPWYSFDPADYKPTEIIRPKSRTFIKAKVTDNPYYMATGYMQQLQMLPEPLRSQMMDGDFMAGVEDDARQVIPTAWIFVAQERWRQLQPRHAKGIMDSLGVDVARGGNMGSQLGAIGHDELVISPRYGTYFDTLIVHKGVAIDDGAKSASLIVTELRDQAPVHIDVVGVGTSPYDFLNTNNIHVIAINGAAKSVGVDVSGLLHFYNLRAELIWRLREALDPRNPDPIALPPDDIMAVDLASWRWTLTAQGVQVESTDDVKKRIGRSPDRGVAVVLANITTPKRVMVVGGLQLPPGARVESYEEKRMRELEG